MNPSIRPNAPDPVDVQAIIDGRKMSAYQIAVIAICVLVLVLDGFDAVMIAYVAPFLAGSLHLAPRELGPLFASGMLGLTVGAFGCGALADKLGRKRVLIASVAIFGGFTLVAASFHELGWLVTLRFLAGIGLGGAGPSAMALIAEMCPSGRRSSQLAWLGCGIPFGGGVAGLVATRLIPAYGWSSMFVVGGLLPLLLLAAIALRVPDSVRFLLLHHAGQEKVRRIMTKIAPELDFANARFVSRNEADQGERRAFVLDLFRGGLATSTLLLWLASFCILMVTYFLTNWLPILLHSTQHTLPQISLLLGLFLVGSPVGSLIVGFLMDRYSKPLCMGACALLAAVCLLVVGQVVSDIRMAAVVIALVGAACGACVTGASIIASFLYPTAARATGIGWTAGCGRLGSVFGTLIGGMLLATGMQVPELLKLAAAPCALASVSFLALRYAARRRSTGVAATAVKAGV
ncbi:MFS transporter [Paraburkholderia acidisoli]|uniref:MFS transporter n=1 Tax=Paraburkholderia acidisoli TaxID=2571748 RepID=A0A7Z2GRR7_9BURK|nr:MFS transporter [Paraburkholderia acidisoli]QGZ66766.1 MFS transporter [Paraburkholderia acidisoli]